MLILAMLRIIGIMLTNFLFGALLGTSETNVQSENLYESEAFCKINTNVGWMRGKQERTLFDDIPYYAFRGIPYAKPPIEKLRFKAPQKLEPWECTLNAFDFESMCLQFSESSVELVGSEDCLHLNVYVPLACSELNPNTKLAAMVYTHGGLYDAGTSEYLGPDFFMEQNVIVVTINYRVGPFGTLSLNLPEYSGNMGLKDQALAIRWVNENIESFGGDKNCITIIGHSSGAVMTNLQMLSPMAKGCFQRAILLDFSALNPVMPSVPTDVFPAVSRWAERLGHNISDRYEAVDFLQQMDAKQVLSFGVGQFTFHPRLDWSYCIEDESAIEPFLTESPFQILTSPDYESDIDALFSISPREAYTSVEKAAFSGLLGLDLYDLGNGTPSQQSNQKQIRDFYFYGEHVLRGDMIDEMNRFVQDYGFNYGIILCARIQAEKSSGRTFLTRFAVESEWNYGARNAARINQTMYHSATHCNVVQYIMRWSEHPLVLLDADYQNLSEDSMERQLIKNTTNLFTNFMKFGNPLPDAEPILFMNPNSSHYYCIDITNDGIFIAEDLLRVRMDFWNHLYNDDKDSYNTTFNFLFD